MKYKLITRFLTSIFLINSFASAEIAKSYAFNFSVCPIGNGNWGNIYYQKKPKEFKKLEFISYERSSQYSYEGVSPIVFFESVSTKEGDQEFNPIASMKLSESTEDLLLFFQKSEDPNSSLFQIIPVGNKLDQFPINSLTFINATETSLFGTFNNQRILLKTKRPKQIPLETHFSGEVVIKLYSLLSNTPKKVMHNDWKFHRNYREIMILFPSASNSPRIRAYRMSQHKDELFLRRSE